MLDEKQANDRNYCASASHVYYNQFSTLYANMINLPAGVKFTAALYMK